MNLTNTKMFQTRARNQQGEVKRFVLGNHHERALNWLGLAPNVEMKKLSLWDLAKLESGGSVSL